MGTVIVFCHRVQSLSLPEIPQFSLPQSSVITFTVGSVTRFTIEFSYSSKGENFIR
uniref:Uncharacterized protein n=1 Tax=Anguilla anguilla TaxID=7936 RepID=A0A0E9RCR6_ANGAN